MDASEQDGARTSLDENWCAGGHPAEALAGSAAQGVRRWLLLELSGRWGRKPPSDCGLPAALTSRLQRALDELPWLRMQLVRRPPQVRQPNAGSAIAPGAWLSERGGRWAISREQLLVASTEDLVELLSAAPEPGATLDNAPWYLVCTHGTRDRCCAKLGQPIFAELSAQPQLRGRVWQCSHLGGHRFAPTLVSLPSGLCFGRLQTPALEGLVSAMEAGELGPADLMRGPCHEDELGQLAYHHAARVWPRAAWADIELQRQAEPGAVRMQLRWREHTLTLRQASSVQLEVLKSCADEAAKSVARARLQVDAG